MHLNFQPPIPRDPEWWEKWDDPDDVPRNYYPQTQECKNCGGEWSWHNHARCAPYELGGGVFR